MCRHHVPLHTILSPKGFFADRTEPTHVNSSGAECRLRKRKIVEHLYRFSGHKILLFSSTTTTATFLLFSLHHHHNHISIVFSPPPPQPHFYCFLSTNTAATFLLFSLHHHHNHISIVFSPPPPPHFYCFPTTSTTTTATTFLSSWKLKQQQKKISEEPRWNKLLTGIAWAASSNSRASAIGNHSSGIKIDWIKSSKSWIEEQTSKTA